MCLGDWQYRSPEDVSLTNPAPFRPGPEVDSRGKDYKSKSELKWKISGESICVFTFAYVTSRL